MTDLKRLKVSLTKHGAHKIALLLKTYDKHEVLAHVADPNLKIDIDLAQARKILSANPEGVIPELWVKAKILGRDAINALVLIAIIFSHYKLISAMQNSVNKYPYSGTIRRIGTGASDVKVYTNLKGNLGELGYPLEEMERDRFQ
jgi:hypothetical protein